jgi:hypothetical protein
MAPLKSLERVARHGCVAGAALLLAGSAAYAARGVDHTTLQSRPSFLGVSGSGIDFLNIDGQSYCYAGTLGSLVEDSAGMLYVLSNNHVLAQESSTIDPVATVGDGIIQPGLLDENGDANSCSPAGTDYTGYIVGQLSAWVPLDLSGEPNEVDAAIAQVAMNCGGASCIDPDGRILEIGGLSGNSVAADYALGMAVQKSGRTTGLTTGVVGAIDVEVKVAYSNGTAHFVNQILVSGDKGAFIKSGDSGSLMVTRPTDGSMPDAVGLLFAGAQNGVAIANPIEAVLDGLGVRMVQCDFDCTNTGASRSGGGGGGGGGGGQPGNHGGGPHFATGGLAVAAEVLDRHRESFMVNPDVVGSGLSVDRDGKPVIQVYTKGAARSVDHPIPAQLEGIKVEVVVTGEFKAL